MNLILGLFSFLNGLCDSLGLHLLILEQFISSVNSFLGVVRVFPEVKSEEKQSSNYSIYHKPEETSGSIAIVKGLINVNPEFGKYL